MKAPQIDNCYSGYECYVCPTGSNIVEDNGDDPVLDDDDENDPGTSQPSEGYRVEDSECGPSGCGVAYSCRRTPALALLGGLIPAAGLRRRRRLPHYGPLP